MAATEEEVAHAELVGEGQTALHSHAGGGGADVKSGTLVAALGNNSVTFNTAFASTPQVVLTPHSSELALRDCLFKITSTSTTGFNFEVDAAAGYSWIATDAGDP